MTNTPLNPDALEAAAKATYDFRNEDYDEQYHDLTYGDKEYEWLSPARVAVSAYLAAAQPVVNSMEVIPAKMRMLAWEGGEFEIGEIPEGHVLVGFEMATDRAWSMTDKVTIHIERKAATNGR